ncbi:MAG: hypothetical protein ACYC8V_09535 [Caulobacteraceae bacterium]
MEEAQPFDAMFEGSGLPQANEEGSQGAPEAPAPDTARAPERGPDGKFVARASDATPPPQAAPEPPQAQETPSKGPEPGHVPVTALMDERDKRQGLEKQLAELKAREAEWQASQAAPATPEARLQAELYAQRLDMSRMFAESRYGADEVKALHDWAVAKCDTDPFFNEQMRSSRNPYEEAAQARNREMIAAKVTPDRLAAFEAWEAAQQAAQGQAAPTPASPPPPRSLANAPNAGGISKVPLGEHVPYEALPFN